MSTELTPEVSRPAAAVIWVEVKLGSRVAFARRGRAARP